MLTLLLQVLDYVEIPILRFSKCVVHVLYCVCNFLCCVLLRVCVHLVSLCIVVHCHRVRTHLQWIIVIIINKHILTKQYLCSFRLRSTLPYVSSSQLSGARRFPNSKTFPHSSPRLQTLALPRSVNTGKYWQCTHKRNTEARSRNYCCRGKAIMYIFWVYLCVCSPSYPACKAHEPYFIVIRDQSGCTVFFHIIP
jgi:hypothetical protein